MSSQYVDEGILTLPMAARVYDIPYSTLYAAVRSGRLSPIHHPGRSILIEREQVHHYAAIYHKLKGGR